MSPTPHSLRKTTLNDRNGGHDEQFRRRAYQLRVDLAKACADEPIPPHPTDELSRAPETMVIPNPLQPDARDPTRLVPYEGPPLTVGGELNKLALNYGSGRTAAGIPWRSDAAASYAQGENLVISLLREQKATFREPFEGFSFTRFDGTRVSI
jgi:hypothetical protein